MAFSIFKSYPRSISVPYSEAFNIGTYVPVRVATHWNKEVTSRVVSSQGVEVILSDRAVDKIRQVYDGSALVVEFLVPRTKCECGDALCVCCCPRTPSSSENCCWLCAKAMCSDMNYDAFHVSRYTGYTIDAIYFGSKDAPYTCHSCHCGPAAHCSIECCGYYNKLHIEADEISFEKTAGTSIYTPKKSVLPML